MKQLLFTCLFFAIPCITQAAVFTLQPRTTNPSIESEWILDVMVQSEKPINAIEGSIAFPKNLLIMLSLSSAGSPINMWIETPRVEDSIISFSHHHGLVPAY